MRFRLTIIFTAALAFSAAASPALQKEDAGAVKSDESSSREQCVPAKDNSISDLTIVEYFDYQCAPCKKVYRVLQQIAHDDGHIQLVLKDWPIFGGNSTYAARLGLAAKYQNK
jgi:protein-disulfide isomerase